MDDILSQLRERAAKAKAKVDRAERALEAARSECADVETAMRVLVEMSGAVGPGQAKGGASEAVAERQVNILNILKEGRNEAGEPKELYSLYSMLYGAEISLDTFRTTIWRMKDKGPYASAGTRWNVASEDGKYWKERVLEGSDEDAL